LQLFKSPKERFLEELIESTRRTMLAFARQHLKDPSQAEDIVQETYYTAWVKIDVLMNSDGLNCFRRRRQR
jgi:DNA-directed RNA polymerase specialized sigma24 family protein